MGTYGEEIFIGSVAGALGLGAVCLAAVFFRRTPKRVFLLAGAAAYMAGAMTFSTPGPSAAGAQYIRSLFLLLSAGFAVSALPAGLFKKTFSTLGARLWRRYEYMDLWLETTEKISSRLETSEIKSFLAEVCGRALGASPVHVWLYEAPSRCFIANSLSIGPSFRRIRAEHRLIEHIRSSTRQPFLLKDALTPEEFRSFAVPLKAEVCAPLIVHGEITGFLLAGRRDRPAYAQDELRLLGAIAAQAAVQVKNVRLSGEILDMKESDLFNRMSSFVAHDLKNLTNSLALLGHNARTNISNPAFQREALKAIDATVVKMRSLVEKMAGGMRALELNPNWSDLRAVMARAAGRLPVKANSRLKIEEGSPLPCLIDEELVETVFLNILTNASEATTDRDEILVSFRQGQGTLSAVISDNGYGIPMPFLENGLFRPFRTTKKDGFGVGLYQCKKVMEAHGGTIEAESEEGKGASFTLKFPLPVGGEKAC
ncbi:Alginate biosynthesis sensor protein KinB [uncultured bacterium]|nr:Alginate biosynthesis sensor protein KinB [uncultured bacterium]